MDDKKANILILGAGPAGLTASLKLSQEGKKNILIEKDNQVGGLCKTVNHNGFLFDMGPHRFFTKSKEVNALWEETLGKDFLHVKRLTRIYYKNKFFNYPIRITNALKGLGPWSSIKIIASFIWSKLFPYPKEGNFEEWTSNRFGKELYRIFFKTYTEKLWGVPCHKLQAEWVAQRIKGLSLSSAVKNAIFPKRNNLKTLVDKFRYPRLGAGMMYEAIGKKAVSLGTEMKLNSKVTRISHNGSKIASITIKNSDGSEEEYATDRVLSSIPITVLVNNLVPAAPQEVIEAAKRLRFRSTLVVNLILNAKNPFPDNWIYVHSAEAACGRILSLKNFSSHSVPEEGKSGLGLEYFCTEGDDFWRQDDQKHIEQALQDLEILGLAKKSQFTDGFVSRLPKTYPVYEENYLENMKIIKDHLSRFENLQPIGRYGMFKYNNMDHSILTGLYAAENILGAHHDLWEVNADQEYHETAKK